VHCDDAEQAYLKVMMDEVFGRDNFIAVVLWEKVYSPKSSAKHLSIDQDYVVVYARRGDAWTPNLMPRTDEADARYRNPDGDPRGPWKPGGIDARNYYSLGRYKIVSPSGKEFDPPAGAYWRYSPARFAELEADNRIWWGPKGNSTPAIKRFLSEVREGMVPRTLWRNAEVGHTQEAKKEIKALFPQVEPFGTPKPERLMQRIVHIASNPGDVVLDCFAGSGTTAAVAQKMGRGWIAVESSRETVSTFTQPRLEKVVAGADPGGITDDVGWEGGGGFRVLEVGPSMFAEAGGRVWLAEWAADGSLGEATAAQLGFAYEPEPPFAGRKGRTRLAVVDGLVNPDVARLLVGALAPEEKVVLCGTAIDPAVTQALRELRPGSRARKIPASILAEYRIGLEWR
jgi:adenine-specific DNA-methyltransferase